MCATEHWAERAGDRPGQRIRHGGRARYPVRGRPAWSQIDAAKAVCRRCPVRAECLSYARGSYARGTGQQDGIWGGTTPEERWASGEIALAPARPAG